jgi:hypothetical protein
MDVFVICTQRVIFTSLTLSEKKNIIFKFFLFLFSDLSLMKDKQTGYVKKELTSYGLDRVEVHEYEVVVTYPDPGRPNQLVVINSTGQVLSNVTLRRSKTTSKVKKILKNGKRDVKQLQPTVIEVIISGKPVTKGHLLE